MKSESNGKFVISLDFELHWGIRDKQGLADCETRLLGARAAIPRLLDLFEHHQVAATWATVGFLFFDDKDELLSYLPEERPRYTNPALSPYQELDHVGPNEKAAPAHFGLSLIRRISETPDQEIASHTFSHYYCLEAGQTPSTFAADLKAARLAADRLNIKLESLVFPRNQANADYLSICRDHQFKVVRGNPDSWLYKAADQQGDNAMRRLGRLADSYLPMTRSRTVQHKPVNDLIDLPATTFLRPVVKSLGLLEPMRLSRILRMMTAVARSGTVFHLWWHPHNFGSDTDANLHFLSRILEHYRRLKDAYGMQSETMAAAAL